ncbi:unnamed protein product [Lampetra fluviatilis]
MGTLQGTRGWAYQQGEAAHQRQEQGTRLCVEPPFYSAGSKPQRERHPPFVYPETSESPHPPCPLYPSGPRPGKEATGAAAPKPLCPRVCSPASRRRRTGGGSGMETESATGASNS